MPPFEKVASNVWSQTYTLPVESQGQTLRFGIRMATFEHKVAVIDPRTTAAWSCIDEAKRRDAVLYL